ncbi:MAG TPA: 3-phosphoserine/phosphohydroxythreonine transaminase [Myxococcota bacterium]|nr:3-phosphoserine/phosphohydroxythreonine transaminase [Myxococcota bacterium]
MTERTYNFSPGPAVLPESVLREAQRDLWDVAGSGIGILEHSHRGPVFERIIAEAEADCRKLAGVPAGHKLLFLQGGASTQFFMLPANFLPDGRVADYVDTGAWSQKAMQEARYYGSVHVAASSKADGYTYIPAPEALRWSERPVYAHFTSNNTIFGTQFLAEPTPPAGAWLACDASSDLFSRPIDFSKYGVLYAGAQKNFGASGVTLVAIREDLLEPPVRELPTMLRYRTHAEQGSLYNTPSTFGVYVMGRVFKWLLAEGGLAAAERRNVEKARILYDYLDGQDFYTAPVAPGSRSLMNVVFRTPTPELDKRFVAEAAKQRLDGLAGHRSAGGMRASLYNAFPRAGCEALVSFMKDFAAKNG